MSTLMASTVGNKVNCQMNTEHLPVCVDDFRQFSESEKQWSARRQFIVKHVEEFKAKENIDQLLSLSMVWVNHVFMRCRYGTELMQKVLEMAVGVDVGEMLSFELVPGSERKKRQGSPERSEGPAKKMLVWKSGSRPRFEPVKFVSSGSSGSSDEKKCEGEETSDSGFQRTKDFPMEENGDCDSPVSTAAPPLEKATTPILKTRPSGGPGVTCHGSAFGLQGMPSASKDVRGHKPPEKSHNSASTGCSEPGPISRATLNRKRRLIAQVSSVIVKTFKDSSTVGGTIAPNYKSILSRSMQACKTNPEYKCVNLKDILPEDWPKDKDVPSKGYACELRCHHVHLATGYAPNKNRAKDRACEQAVRLLLELAEVRVVPRRHGHALVNDIVLCQVSSPAPRLATSPCGTEENGPQTGAGRRYDPYSRKDGTKFVIVENARAAVSILNNSVEFNHKKIDYRFDPVPNSSIWQCSVYLEDELVAQAKGTKKKSKRAAAEKALRKLRTNQAVKPQELQPGDLTSGQPGGLNSGQPGSCHDQNGGRKEQLNQLVILENSSNAVCVINDTAQFNKVPTDYKFEAMSDNSWKCKVYLDGQFVAEAIGPRKTVKQAAAGEALVKLRQTQAVVKYNMHKDCDKDTAISRNQILGCLAEETERQEIQEDNIGNQLLRKMGWTGGGLGREGEGIAKPIQVKEQFSREGLGMEAHQLNKRDIEGIVRRYASSDREDDLRFSEELSNEERKQIHQTSQRYGLRSKSYGRGTQRFLIVSRKVPKEQLIGQLLQVGQVGRYELLKP